MNIAMLRIALYSDRCSPISWHNSHTLATCCRRCRSDARTIVSRWRAFLARQRLLGVSAAGDDGQLWTSVWTGRPGFVRSVDGERVTMATAAIAMAPEDPV